MIVFFFLHSSNNLRQCQLCDDFLYCSNNITATVVVVVVGLLLENSDIAFIHRWPLQKQYQLLQLGVISAPNKRLSS